MAHGDANDERLAGCACSHCSLTRNFAAFRDSILPERPVAITSQAEAAGFLMWLAAQICEMIDAAKGDAAAEEE